MPVWSLSSMTWEEVRDLDPGQTLAILPLGACEAHGPHLSLDTDVIIGEAMARAGAERLAQRGYEVVILPTLPYGPAPFAGRFAGTVSIEPATLTAAVTDIARDVHRHGMAALGIANAHLDPAHLTALERVTQQVPELPLAAPNLTRRALAARLTDEFRSGACHAGRFETSVIMAGRPAAVREAKRQRLEPNPASLSDAIRAGKRTFDEAGGARAYFGWPADATAAEGFETIAILGQILEESVLEALGVT